MNNKEHAEHIRDVELAKSIKAIPEERKAVLRKCAEGEAERILAEAGHSALSAESGAVMNMPHGRVIAGAHPKIVAMAGPDLARSLMFAQLRHDPGSQIPALNAAAKRKTGLSIAERRLAKIEAGKLKIENGRLVGG